MQSHSDHNLHSPKCNVVLKCTGLKKWFPIRKGILRHVAGHIKAVDGVDLELFAGETLGLVGESGCGKTSFVQTLLRIEEPTAGSVWMQINGGLQNILQFDARQMKEVYRHVQVVFQDPFSSMNPRLSVSEIIAEPLRIHKIATGKEKEKRVHDLLHAVGLSPHHARQFPHAFSGGQRQRIGIARALILNPKIIIADEPVSALDVSIQSQILNLLNKLKSQFNLTYLIIAHNLNVIKYMSDRIAVMYLGCIVELGPADETYYCPQHPYTESLLMAIPAIHPNYRMENKNLIQEDLPDPAAPPPGCPFHTRCRYAKEKCVAERPQLREISAGHCVSCHFTGELNLVGGKRK